MSAASACGRAFQSRDIVRHICTELEPRLPDSKVAILTTNETCLRNATALARLARVSRALSGPALDVLWRVVDDLPRLLYILPSFTMLAESFLYVISRPIKPEEWDRFQLYARRVREYYVDTESSSSLCAGISPSVWTFLARWCPQGHSLLPNLRRLDALHMCHSGHILLLTPSLRDLKISEYVHELEDWDEDPYSHCLVFEVMHKISLPHLESLRTEFLLPHYAARANGPEDYAKFAHLRSLEITGTDRTVTVDEPLLQALAGFPFLRRLRMNACLELPEKRPLPPNSFKLLQELGIIADLDHLGDFLEIIPPPRSLALGVTDWRKFPPDRTKELFQSVLSNIPESTSQLSFILPYSASENELRAAELIRPTLAFSWLTHLSITIEEPCTAHLLLNDEELRTFAAAWPNLREFEFQLKQIESTGNDDDDPEYHDDPKAQSIALFAQNHPRLTRLVLPFLHARSSKLPALDTVPFLDHCLRTLRLCVVGNGGLADKGELAVFLDYLFPNLDLSATACFDSPEVKAELWIWYELQRMLLCLQIGRTNVLVPRRRREEERQRNEAGS
ncbi:hypothetical protein GY45DRAFT_1439510 [Cubamyces sp. BRFM 1775]|nr:hypothetical protein GY45DRAFT_1439510 [Cubamyces sp. BRFM 1775]